MTLRDLGQTQLRKPEMPLQLQLGMRKSGRVRGEVLQRLEGARLFVTNVSDTSLLAYTDKVLPNINRKQNAILQWFLHHQNCNYTNAELAAHLGWPINHITGRVYELRGRDHRFPKLVANPLLEMASRRVCTETGNLAKAWKLTQHIYTSRAIG